MTSPDVPLSGNTFFIYNKQYPQAKLAQWGTGGRDVGTYEQSICPDQLWYLNPSTEHSDYYYIENAYRKGYRLAKWSSGDQKTGVYNKQYYDDQLWRFQKEGDYYRIYNKVYSNARLAKWGKGDSAWGSYSGANYDDQLWKLVPRYQASVGEKVLLSIDNRQGSCPVPRTIKVTHGVKLTRSENLSTKLGFEYSLKSSLSAGIKGIKASEESSYTFSFEIQQSVTNSKEESWSTEVSTTYTAPAGKMYKVVQKILDFNSPYQADNCALFSTERIEESD